MKPIIKKMAREIRAAFPFALVNTNPKSDLSKVLSYSTVEEAKNAGFDAYVSNTNISSLSSPIQSWPNIVSTEYNSRYISIVDLNNHKCVWDWPAARNQMKTTSWYNELGPPPTHGIFVVDNAGTSIHWLDRENPTLQKYMTFECSLNNMIALNPINSIYFLDFKLYVVGVGQSSDRHVFVVDFLQDERISYNNTGVEIYDGDINQRNTGSGNKNLTKTVGNYSAPANNLPAGTINIKYIKAIRVYNTDTDYLGRPKHSWLVTGQNNVMAVYNVQIEKISYASDLYAAGIQTSRTCDIDYSGRILYTYRNNGNTQTFGIGRNINTITTDSSFNNSSIRVYNYDFQNEPSGAFVDNVSFINSPLSRIYKYGGSVLFGTDQALSIINWGTFTSNAYDLPISYITTTSSFITPYMKGSHQTSGDGVGSEIGVGAQRGSWPLNDSNDRSLRGWNLTDTSTAGSVTFNNDGPFGFKCATFNGSNSLDATINDDFYSAQGFTISMMIKTTNATNIPSIFTIAANMSTSQVSNRIFVGLNSSGYAYYQFWDNSGNTVTSNPSRGYVADGAWHHIVLVFNRSLGLATLYVDGIISDIISAANITDQFIFNGGKARIGGDTDNNSANFFYGDIAMVSSSIMEWEYEEVLFEYERMKASLGNTPYLLAADDIDSIKVDRESDRAIITAGNSAHIMNTRNGLITDRIAISSGTLLDADIINIEGSDNPHYVLAGDTSIEQVASSNTIGARQ